jgi:hypothetical protein
MGVKGCSTRRDDIAFNLDVVKATPQSDHDGIQSTIADDQV